jgi:hypothetical protein
MRWAIIVAVLLTALQALADDFLRRGDFSFVPSAGSRAVTTRPLDPSKRYRILITATHGYTLSPLLHCFERRVPGFLGVFRDKTFCTIKLLFDGEALPPYPEHTNTEWGYFLFDFDHTIYYRPSVEAYLYGTGRRLAISIQDDLTYAVPQLRLAITDIDYVQAQQLLEAQRERQLILEAEQRKIREAEERQRLLELQAAIRRRQYLQALKYIFFLALLTVGTGLVVRLMWVHRPRIRHRLEHLRGKTVNKSHITIGLPEKTRR